MRSRLPRFALGAASIAVAVAVAAQPALAQPALAQPAPAQPTSGTTPPPAASAEHASLESALGAVGMSQADFDAQAALADRLAVASETFATTYPQAFAGARVEGQRGLVGIVPGTPGAAELGATVVARGFEPTIAPKAAADLDQVAELVDEWKAALPPEKQAAVVTTGVDATTGKVTVVLADTPEASSPPANLNVQVRTAPFRNAQGSSSSTGTGTDDPRTNPGTPPTATSLMGGDRYLAVDTKTTSGNWCSLGFNGQWNGKPVNITAAHCTTFNGLLTFSPSVVREDVRQPALGQFTASGTDTSLDAALISTAADAQSRFTSGYVRSTNAQPLGITGYQKPTVGLTICKYGQRSGYTCGKILSLDTGTGKKVQDITATICALSGDSGGPVFSGQRAIGIVSKSNAFDEAGVGYSSCAQAKQELQKIGQQPQIVSIGISAILDRFPTLTLTNSL